MAALLLSNSNVVYTSSLVLFPRCIRPEFNLKTFTHVLEGAESHICTHALIHTCMHYHRQSCNMHAQTLFQTFELANFCRLHYNIIMNSIVRDWNDGSMSLFCPILIGGKISSSDFFCRSGLLTSE